MRNDNNTSQITADQDDVSGSELAALAVVGGAFDWLAGEPDAYDDTCGESLIFGPRLAGESLVRTE